MTPTACFVSASRQNVFFAELLDALAEELARTGVAIERAVDHFPAARDGLVYVFVPHELLPLLMADAHPSDAQLRRSVTICTEQPGTHWFEETAEVCARAASTVDINRLGVSTLRKRGVDARFLQLGYTPRWDRWHGAPDAARPTDVVLLAGATPRRLDAVARCGRVLARKSCELHLPEALVPHRAGSASFIAGTRKWELLARSRVILNIHRGELGYFEWQRAVEAIANGCVLVSEHSLGFEPLIPGEHFISASFENLDVALEAALGDEQRLSRIRERAYSLMKEQHPLSAAIDVLGEAIHDAAATPLAAPTPGKRERRRPARSRRALPPPAWAETAGPDAAGRVRRRCPSAASRGGRR